MNGLQQQIERLTAQFAKVKAQELLREQAQKNRQQVHDRKARNRRMYVLGGMVEKMGLDAIDDALLIGVLSYGHDLITSGDAGTVAELRQVGQRELGPSVKRQRLFSVQSMSVHSGSIAGQTNFGGSL